MDKKIKKELILNTHFGKSKNQPYQTIGSLHGSRDMEYRYKFMQIPENFNGKTVLDIGCNAGMMCMEAKRRGAQRVVGLDYDSNVINTAKRFFKQNECDVEFYHFNVNNGLRSLQNLIGIEKFDYVFALSIWGSVKKSMLWDIINQYCKYICWFEGHNKDRKRFKIMRKELNDNLKFSHLDFLGNSTDRGIRPVFRITR